MMGWVGPVRSRRGTSGFRMVPYGSVYQSYTDTGQSSDPSGLVGSRRAISGSDGFPSEPCFGTTGPDGARRIARLSRIGARLMYGPIREPTASPGALRGPLGTRRAPGGPPAAPSDPVFVSEWALKRSKSPSRGPSGPEGPPADFGGTVRPCLIGASPVWAARNSYWRSRGYLYFMVEALQWQHGSALR